MLNDCKKSHKWQNTNLLKDNNKNKTIMIPNGTNGDLSTL